MEQRAVYLAHVRENGPQQWQEHLLEDHLRAVARLAGEFAAAFASRDWAYIAGLWHDLGKYRQAFQQYIRNASGYNPNAHIEIETAPGRVDHSTAGALYAEQQLGERGRVLAYLIAGHHAGLPDYDTADTGRSALKSRLQEGHTKNYLNEALRAAIPADIRTSQVPSTPPIGNRDGFRLWICMLFSCLTDADFLDTEYFMTPSQAEVRIGYPRVEALLAQFNLHMETLQVQPAPTPVDAIRQQVLGHCRTAASQAPGAFSLTVPTGGGKTLSSLAFALEHAVRHGKRRVIYAIPYTSIIEQTAEVFRDVFRPLGNVVIEHHSQADVDPQQETAKSRLACENWDAPLIVTTNVQFFESLYAARPSRCRKLHNIVNSVVILDEAQLLPPEYLGTLCQTIKLLTQHYGVTFVFCTATQPKLGSYQHVGKVFRGLDLIREIVPNPRSLFQKLRRVRIEWPSSPMQPQTWADLATALQEHEQVLCIVNGARRDARELWHLMPPGTYHLSALMCGQHRSDQFKDIRAKLNDNVPLRVISTPLVEAGVDVDFPIVYRALSGLDSIAQAAGRCNRNGKLPRLGQVKVFVGPNPVPRGLTRTREYKTRELLHHLSGDPLSPEWFERYFDLLYGSVDTDTKGIIALSRVDDTCLGLSFRTLANRFKLIDDREQHTVFVRYGEGNKLIEQFRSLGPERWLLRKLQRYSVTIYENELQHMLRHGMVETMHGFFVQQTGFYHADLGLLLEAVYNSEDLIF
jgi:CRISPR-associated endonuclease/helicase Cas3